MSKAKAVKPPSEGTVREVQSVTLPQFPKSDDTKAQLRAKWIQDYDKVEAELLKPHLGPRDGSSSASAPNRPPPTAVISLRQLPDDWELQHRAQVARQEELALERQRKLEKMKKNKALGGSQPSPERGRESTASFYHTSPLPGSTQSAPAAGGGVVAARARAATTDPYDIRNRRDDFAAAPTGRNTALGLSPVTPKLQARPTIRSPRVQSANVSKPRPVASTSPPPHSMDLSSPVRGVVTAPFPAVRLPNAEECAGVIVNLLAPPPSFRHCITSSLANIDIGWLRRHRAGDRPSANLTLETIRDDLNTNPSVAHATALNSPRSVIVMMRNGVTVEDLQVAPLDAFVKKERTVGFACVSSSLALGPGSKRHAQQSHDITLTPVFGKKDTAPDSMINPATAAAVEEEVARMAAKHVEDRRVELLASLRTEYRQQCREAPLLDVVDLVQRELARKEEERKARIRLGVSGKPRTKVLTEAVEEGEEVGKGEATFLKERRGRLERQVQMAKERMERQIHLAAQQSKKEAEAEERRLQAEREHDAKIQEAKDETIRRQHEASNRLEELRADLGRRQDVFVRSLEERQKRLAEKEEALQRARQNRREETAATAARKAEKRAERSAKQHLLKEKQREEALQRQAEQEEADRQRREKQERERQELAEQIEASQANAKEARLAKKRLAEKHEQETIERAREKANAAEQRMRQFHESQMHARHEQHLKDLKKMELREGAFRAASDAWRARNEALVDKQLQHEALLRQVQESTFVGRTVAKEKERLQEDDKKVFISRRVQAAQFLKLMAISSIRNKADRGAGIEQTRQALQERAKEEQRRMLLEKEKNEQRLYAMRVANQL